MANTNNQTVEKMIEIFLSMKPGLYITVSGLYEKAINQFDNPELSDFCYCWEFHNELVKRKIRIKHLHNFNGENVGRPEIVDVFCLKEEK